MYNSGNTYNIAVLYNRIYTCVSTLRFIILCFELINNCIFNHDFRDIIRISNIMVLRWTHLFLWPHIISQHYDFINIYRTNFKFYSEKKQHQKFLQLLYVFGSVLISSKLLLMGYIKLS